MADFSSKFKYSQVPVDICSPLTTIIDSHGHPETTTCLANDRQLLEKNIDRAASRNHFIRDSHLAGRSAFCNYSICYEACGVLKGFLQDNNYQVEIKRTTGLEVGMGFPSADHYFIKSTSPNGDEVLVDGGFIQMLRSMVQDNQLPKQDIIVLGLSNIDAFIGDFSKAICNDRLDIRISVFVPSDFGGVFVETRLKAAQVTAFFHRLWSGGETVDYSEN
jgi:hypothetical protein